MESLSGRGIFSKFKLISRASIFGILRIFKENYAPKPDAASSEYIRGYTQAAEDIFRTMQVCKSRIEGSEDLPHLLINTEVFRVDSVIHGVDAALDPDRYKPYKVFHISERFKLSGEGCVRNFTDYSLEYYTVNSDSIFLIINSRPDQSQVVVM